ncbi:hypothetical protein BFP97_05170 [Roseivirga sp. 4D4]|nr:hypothetical protein BFP97_05170 [Roseivirga sp. 4D4]
MSIKERNKSTFLLSILLLLIGLRVAKSTLYLFTDSIDIVVMNIGFSAHFATGPLLWHYLRRQGGHKLTRRSLVHYIPALLVLVAANWLSLESFWYKGAYSLLLIQSLIYLTLAISDLKKLLPKISGEKKTWILLLLLGIGAFLLGYFTNYVLRFNPYYLAPLTYSFVIYSLSFYLIRHLAKIVQEGDKKYRNLHLSKDELIEYANRINSYLNEGTPYLDNGFTLAILSDQIAVPKHILSATFSEFYKVNFNDHINHLRVERAKQALIDQPYLTVASIAFDCGFNSLSSFNQSFKKFTRQTPSAYRKSIQI